MTRAEEFEGLRSIDGYTAAKSRRLAAFDIGVILTEFGELVTGEPLLHRSMHGMLFTSYGMLAAFMFGWIYLAKEAVAF